MWLALRKGLELDELQQLLHARFDFPGGRAVLLDAEIPPMTGDLDEHRDPRLEFRAAPALGPAALARPSGIVVVRDDALKLKLRMFHHFASSGRATRLSPDPDIGMAGRTVQAVIDVLEGMMIGLLAFLGTVTVARFIERRGAGGPTDPRRGDPR